MKAKWKLMVLSLFLCWPLFVVVVVVVVVLLAVDS